MNVLLKFSCDDACLKLLAKWSAQSLSSDPWFDAEETVLTFPNGGLLPDVIVHMDLQQMRMETVRMGLPILKPEFRHNLAMTSQIRNRTDLKQEEG